MTGRTFQVMTDSRIRKSLARLNETMGLPKGYYMFYFFRHSGLHLETWFASLQYTIEIGDRGHLGRGCHERA